MTPLLFQPITIRGLTLNNRIVIAPMCQYSADDGMMNDWHFAHLSKFAIGRAGAVMTEAAAVQERGRITHGDLGIWSDAHGAAMKRTVAFIKAQGSAAAIQIAHAGRKASMQRPWFGNGPLGAEDTARGDHAWDVIGPSARPLDEGWLQPAEMGQADIDALIVDFVAAAKRADAAGFDIVELHGAHGYLMQTFLSPLSNFRTDSYGGDLAGRMRLPLQVAKAVREAWPVEKPLFMRISSVDGVDGGWEIEDSVALAKELKLLDIDVVDCSAMGNTSGGATANPTPRGAGHQSHYAAKVRAEAGVATMAVGHILDGATAEQVLQEGRADLIAIGREALYNPFWPVHEAHKMGLTGYESWPVQYGWWLVRRQKSVDRIRNDPAFAELPPV